MKQEELIPGLKIRMKLLYSQIDYPLCHIEAVLENTVYPQMGNMIVFRYWSKYRKRWFWQVYSYWELQLWNKWYNE
jgi:hypothetical protein